MLHSFLFETYFHHFYVFTGFSLQLQVASQSQFLEVQLNILFDIKKFSIFNTTKVHYLFFDSGFIGGLSASALYFMVA